MKFEEYWIIEDFKGLNNDTPLQKKLSITIDESMTRDSERGVCKTSIETDGQLSPAIIGSTPGWVTLGEGAIMFISRGQSVNLQ